jgi:hypothetical protein
MQIEASEPHLQNASFPIRETLEPVSNATVNRDSHSKKQYASIVSTDEGMQIDESEEHFENAEDSIRET